MARRRLTPAQPGYLSAGDGSAPESKAMPFGSPPPIAKVSGQSAEAAALRELAEGIESARAEGRMIVDVPLADISAEFLLRDRLVLDREELDALKASIRSHGQRTPAEITPLTPGETGHRFGLISGWRRLRALSELFAETGEARFSTLRALIRPAEEAAASYVAMVEENEIRVGLSYYERARVVAELVTRGVFADHGAALRELFATASRAKRSKIGSFVEIHEALGDLLRFPADIPERLGLSLVTLLRQEGPEAVRAVLVRAEAPTAEAELAALTRAVAPRKADVSRAKPALEALAPGLELEVARHPRKVTLTFSGPAANEDLVQKLRALLCDLDI